jgi:hypothetical protein
MEPVTQEELDRACFRLLTQPDLAPLIQWWEHQLMNGAIPPLGQVDPLRLAMAQGDRERLVGIKARADRYRKSTTRTEE